MVSNSVKNNLKYLENINSLVNEVFGDSNEWLGRRSELIQIIDNIQKDTKSKKEKKRKDVNAPKKNLSAYLHFCAKNRDNVKASLDSDNELNLSLLKKLGNDWKELENKDEYNNLASIDKARYEDEMSRYVSTVSSSDNDSSYFSKSSIKKPKSSIKKPKSGWTFYCMATREEVKNALTRENGDEPSFSDISKRLGEMWKELDEIDKTEFKELANGDKERYKRETENNTTKVVNEHANEEKDNTNDEVFIIEEEEEEKPKHRVIKKKSKK
jgi:hypothetical protein